MALSVAWEREFIDKGFSLATVSFIRNISEVVQPGTISLDVTELEALQHEFRLLRSELDSISDKIQNLELNHMASSEIKQDVDEQILVGDVVINNHEPEIILNQQQDIDGRLQELEILLWQT